MGYIQEIIDVSFIVPESPDNERYYESAHEEHAEKPIYHFYCDKCGSWEYTVDKNFRTKTIPGSRISYVDTSNAFLICLNCGDKWKQVFSDISKIKNPLNKSIKDVPEKNRFENELSDWTYLKIIDKNPDLKEPPFISRAAKSCIIFLAIFFALGLISFCILEFLT